MFFKIGKPIKHTWPGFFCHPSFFKVLFFFYFFFLPSPNLPLTIPLFFLSNAGIEGLNFKTVHVSVTQLRGLFHCHTSVHKCFSLRRREKKISVNLLNLVHSTIFFLPFLFTLPEFFFWLLELHMKKKKKNDISNFR